MTTDMNETKLTTLEQVRAFLARTSGVGFAVPSMGADERYQHLAQVLSGCGYLALTRPDKGLTLRYLQRTTGYSH